MRVIKKEDYRVPVFSWCPIIEAAAFIQIDNVARLPFVTVPPAVMRDCHPGYGVPIGMVLACDDTVIPNAVGVDVGCGMAAIKTNLRELPQLKKIMSNIRKRVPVGFDWHKSPVKSLKLSSVGLPVVKANKDKAELQLGTLGGGNHFIEIQKDQDGFIWFMIHSGSRNLGKQVADHYNKVAKELNAKWSTSVPKGADLAFLPAGDPNFELYLEEMLYAVDFAQQNRDIMADQIKEAFVEEVGEVSFEPTINIAHNYANWEEIRGQKRLVHRKGATSARQGEIGIIPGSQGTASYIVRGLGNPKSMNSCSHGAGRVYGRADARRKLDLAAEIKRLDDLGIVHSIRSEKDLDEAAGAYKDIQEVMADQADLVEIVTKLVPLGVIKG